MSGLPAPPPAGSAALPAGTFAGDVAFVTGGGTGLGKAIAVEFARLGATVVVASRAPEHLRAGVQAIEAAGGTGLAVQCDVRDEQAVAAAFDQATQAAGAPTILVNNAAGNFPVAAQNLSPNGWRAVTDIVLDGTFLCSRELALRLIPQQRAGAIVNVGASYAWTGGPGFAHSAAAKAGVKNLTETLAVEWAPYGIRVNYLVPGLVPHDDEVGAIRAVPGRGDAEAARAPALRVGEPREIGWAATFLASPFAAYITGATLTVDGANWQRRSLTQPPFIPIAEQLQAPPRAD